MTDQPQDPRPVSDASPRFIVDHNVAKLARWLRMMGYDTLVFVGPDDTDMVRIALREDRILVTRDTGVMKRRVITSGRLPALLVAGDDPEAQIRQVITRYSLGSTGAFTRCIECNVPLEERALEAVLERVPPNVAQTQTRYVECPLCRRIYWKGTHWQAMKDTLERFGEN